MIAFVLEYIGIGYCFFIIACVLTLAIGAFWFVVSMISEIKRILRSTDDKAHTNVIHLIEFTEFIDNHGTMKMLSSETNFRI